MGKCVASHHDQGHNDLGAVWSLVFTPDSKGLVTGSGNKTVIHWDVSWLGSTQWDNETARRKTSDILTEFSHFLEHKVRR